MLAKLAGTSHRSMRNFESIPFAALEVSPAALAALAADDFVVSIQEDVAEPAVVNQSAPLIEATAAWGEGFDGGGQVVAVLDTGADASHPMLAGKLVAEACFSNGRDCPNNRRSQIGTGAAVPCDYSTDQCAHGTHVSGIAVGNGPTLDGIARGANLIPIQVFSEFSGSTNCGTGPSPCALSYVSDQVKGMEHVLSLSSSHSIAAVNVSLGGARYTSTCDASESARKAAIDNLRSVGIATVVASGNDSDSNGISTPACISTAISVGSTTKWDTVSSFSNSDTFLSLLAPGQSILSAVPGGGTEAWNGTSMATPHVAGAWAILKQYSPAASVSDILSALQSTGLPVTDSRNSVTTSRIQIQSAMANLTCLDSDADGVCDIDDICPGADDTLDADLDGAPDGCDVCPNDPLDDADADGVCGDVDVCPGFDDAVDADFDGTPDGCDVCPNDPLDDADADGVCGDVDVCSGFDDAIDADSDGSPDGCDVCPNDPLDDADADGVCGDVDVCEGHDDALDPDGDGVPNGCDPDDDADGLLDGVESGSGTFVSAGDTGSDPLLLDSDGDGFNDGDEVAAGSDPNDFASQPPILGVPALAVPSRLLLALVVLMFGRVALAGRRGGQRAGRRRWFRAGRSSPTS
jgi:subtilisin